MSTCDIPALVEDEAPLLAEVLGVVAEARPGVHLVVDPEAEVEVEGVVGGMWQELPFKVPDDDLRCEEEDTALAWTLYGFTVVDSTTGRGYKVNLQSNIIPHERE